MIQLARHSANMNPVPSTSRVPNLRDYNIAKLLGKKTYVPNLSASRAPKVKAEENAEAKKDETSAGCSERRKFFRERKIVQGSETFAPVANSSAGCRFAAVKSKQRGAVGDSAASASSHSQSALKQEAVKRDKSAQAQAQQQQQVAEIPSKSYTGKFASVSSALPEDLPVSVPRPRLSAPGDTKKSISLLMDLFDPSGDESPIFILKTPKYLPSVSESSADVAAAGGANTSKGEANGEPQKCTIHDLAEGRIGTLQIMKSGRLRLLLGECKFWLHRGVSVDFREELVFVNTDAEMKSGQIVNLGAIKDRIIAVPESVTVFANDDHSLC